MKIAHVAVVTPHRAGLYETTRDLVAAIRTIGHDARIVDPLKQIEMVDRGVPIVDASFAQECQLLVNHSGLGKKLDHLQLPIIHILHGRPHSSFLLGQAGKIAVYSYLARIRKDSRFKAFVTFWPEFLPYWEMILPAHKLYDIMPPVDLGAWTPDGPAGYGFHGHAGKINVVCTSMWRADETPYHIINAFRLFAETTKDARLHIYAAPQKGSAWAVLKSALEERGMLGEVVGIVQGLANVYRAADAAITPHRIATRSVREPLACGCNVVMASSNCYTPFQADPENLAAYAIQISQATQRKTNNRKVAETFFNPRNAAQEFILLAQKVVHNGID